MSQPMRDDPWFGSERAVVSSGLVVAWRRWRLRPDGSGEPLLASAHEDHIWHDRSLQAACDPSRTWSYRMSQDREDGGGHQPPAAGCRCGIYAYRTPELARPMAPGVWVYGRVLVGGPMYETDAGYRGREATIDGPFGLTIECVGGDDLYAPTRCFEPSLRVKFDAKAFLPVCASHPNAPVGGKVKGDYTMADFLRMAACLAAELETLIATRASR